MGVTTRKRAVAAVEDAAPGSATKRIRSQRLGAETASPTAASPQLAAGGSPALKVANPGSSKVPKTGSRGSAYLDACGIKLPPLSPAQAASSPASTSARKRGSAPAVPSVLQPPAAAKPRNPLLRQALPQKLTALLDMYAGLQTVYEMMRKRQQRTTYQHMRQAVEEASGRRFLVAHVSQLQHLLPEVVELEWVRLPVAAHSSRTEPHLLINLNLGAAAEAAAGCGAAPAAGGELQAARQLLHCRLAEHLLGSYRGHLEGRLLQLKDAGDEEAGKALEVASAAAAQPPVLRFLDPYPEGVADVPQQQLPPRPDAAMPARSPAVLGGGAAAAVSVTPAGNCADPPPSTGRAGRPPVHPATADRRRIQQRRLSFSSSEAAAAAAAAAAGAQARQATPSKAALLTAAGYGQNACRSGQADTPLGRLHEELDRQQWPHSGAQGSPRQRREQLTAGQQRETILEHEEEEQAGSAAQVHPSQAALAASLTPEDLQFNGSILSEDDAGLLASMPEQLRRMSTDGIISLDTLRKLDAAEQQHRRLSGREAQERRQSNAALGQLPRTFSRVQRIFGVQGPNALKLQDVVLRIKQGGAESSSEAQIEAQLRALAEHAPEFVSVRPYGKCGTPALWVNRACNGNALMQRLKQVAEARLQPHTALA